MQLVLQPIGRTGDLCFERGSLYRGRMTTQPAPTRRRTKDVVSQEVRAWAGRLGLRQRHLAEILGISQAQVSARLRGQVSWNLDELDLLATAFGVQPGEFMATPPRGIPAGASGVLPRLDSNQQPAGYGRRVTAPRPVTRAA